MLWPERWKFAPRTKTFHFNCGASQKRSRYYRKIAGELPELGSFTEIIFVEGNSTDNTYEKIVETAEKFKDKKKIKFAKQSGKGKGDAVRKGFEMATGDIFSHI